MRFLQLEDLSHDRKLKFPFTIKVLKNGKPARIFHYQEAAELDYDFNWAVDFHWKIFATVLGYCTSEYSVRGTSTFMTLYTAYSQDVLQLIMKDW